MHPTRAPQDLLYHHVLQGCEGARVPKVRVCEVFLPRPGPLALGLCPCTPWLPVRSPLLPGPQVTPLLENFRTHAAISSLAHYGVLEVLLHFFPDALDKLPPETSQLTGERRGPWLAVGLPQLGMSACS